MIGRVRTSARGNGHVRQRIRTLVVGMLAVSLLSGCVTSPRVSFATATPDEAERSIHERSLQLIRRRGASHGEAMYVVSKDATGFVDGKGRRVEYADVVEVGTPRQRTSAGDAVAAGLLMPFLLPCVLKKDRNCFQ